MSLDVYLNTIDPEATCEACGQRVPNSMIEVYTSNITHNLGTMAREVGVYQACWRPEEIDITHAHQLIPILRTGIAELKENSDKYKLFDAPNGWGTYEQFVLWLEEYLSACVENPDALVRVDR